MIKKANTLLVLIFIIEAWILVVLSPKYLQSD